MEYKQREKQEGINKPVLAHARMRLTIQEEKVANAPIGLFGAIGIILYVFIFHELANAGFIWFLGLMISFGLSAGLGYAIMLCFEEKRRLKKGSDSARDPDSELFR